MAMKCRDGKINIPLNKTNHKLLFNMGVLRSLHADTAGAACANAADVLATLEASKDLFFVEYHIRIWGTNLGPNFPATWWTFSAAGVRISAETFSLRAGVGQCDLLRYRKRDDGTFEHFERRDVRHLEKIATDDKGDVFIDRKKIPRTLLRLLAEMRDFAAKFPGDEKVSLEFD